MNLELVARLARGAHFLPPGIHPAAYALSLVPSLVDALPDVGLGPEDRAVSFPVVCGGLLTGLVERALRGAVDEALTDIRPPPPEELANRLQSDPLTQALRRLIGEGLTLSPAAGTLAGLEYVRLCAHHLSAPGPLLRDGVGKVRGEPAWVAGTLLGRVIAPFQARLSAACFDLARAGIRVPTLLSALAASPLAFAPQDAARDVPISAALLNHDVATASESSTRALEVGFAAFDEVIVGLLDRLAQRRAGADDQAFALRFCVTELLTRGTEAARAALAMEPDAYALVLPQLSRWLDAGALVHLGLDAQEAANLLRPETGVAIGAQLRRALREMAAADVLAQVLRALTAVGDATIEARLTMPRGQPVQGTVVAVATGNLRAAMAEPIALPREVSDAVCGWRAALGSGVLGVDDGTVAWFAFGDAALALRFALSLRDRPSAGLPTPASAIASGPLSGGTDGATVRLAGPTIQDAARLLAHVPMSTRPAGLTETSRLAAIDGVLSGSGVAIDASTLAELREANLRRAPEGRPPGFAVVDAWEGEDVIILVTALHGVARAYEATRLTFSDWEALCASGAAAPAPVVEKVEPAKIELPAAPAPPKAVPVNPVMTVVPPPERAPTAAEGAAPEPTRVPSTPPAERVSPTQVPRPPADSTHEVRRPKRSSSNPVVAGPPAVSTELITPALLIEPEPEPEPATALVSSGGSGGGDPFASFIEGPASDPVSAQRPAASGGDPFANDPFTNQDESVEREAERMGGSADGFALPVLESPPEPTRATEVKKGKKPATLDFQFLLGGYACYVERGRVAFGRPYGTRIIDLHAFDTSGDLDRAYQAFVEAKISEGFIPRTDLTGDLPRGVTVMPLDQERLAAAWRNLS